MTSLLNEEIRHEQIIELPVECCTAWRTEVDADSRLVESIERYGIITPLLARAGESKFEVWSGRRRLSAAWKLNKQTVPVIIRYLTDDEVRVLRTEEDVTGGTCKYSKLELAKEIYSYYSTIKHQGKSTERLQKMRELQQSLGMKTFCPVGEKDSLKQTASLFNLSARTVSRLLRINNLISGLQTAVDKNRISLRTAVELSYLAEYTQVVVCNTMRQNRSNIRLDVAQELRKYQEDCVSGEVDSEIIHCIMEREPYKTGNFPPMRKIYQKYNMKRFTEQQVRHIVDEALRKYFEI